jgi:hypothetical protein
MKVLSIDVGIKNLAFCLFVKPEDGTSNYEIAKWDSINLSQQIESKCCEVEKFKDCNKPAKFIKNGKCYCLKHSKKQPFQVPTADLKPASINKQKLNALELFANKHIKDMEKKNIKIRYVIKIINYCKESIRFIQHKILIII